MFVLTGVKFKESKKLTFKLQRTVNEYSQLSLRRTPLGPALSVRLIQSQIKGVKKDRDQL